VRRDDRYALVAVLGLVGRRLALLAGVAGLVVLLRFVAPSGGG
jgi:hypothetical protein